MDCLKSSKASRCLLPQMCWDPICTVAVAMSGFLMAVSWWRHRLHCIVIIRSFLRLLKLNKLEVGKLDLSRGCLLGVTVC